jgi:hypothetical protein
VAKSEEQWCRDNGVPETARYSGLGNAFDVIKQINHLLLPHGLKVRTKQRRDHMTGSMVWIERNDPK